MAETSSNNKRIAKNTLLLYCRTLIIMLVSLYTSRVVLKVLGIEDYGIYNVVGGIVVMFSFISSTLGSASQRYIAYDLAQNNEVRLRQTFSLIMLSYGIVALMTLVLAEIIGVWFLNSHMNIPENRMVAANWVLQASIIGFIINIFTAPYMAVIIAHERMNVYAYLSILDAVLKLSSVYILQVILFDSLIVYAILILLCTIIVTTIYRCYCRKHYSESHYSYCYDSQRFRELMIYSWWNMVGSLAMVLRSQGVNILLNVFFCPAVNAARGIAYQVNAAITSFSSNFYTAVRPQITKNYSLGNEFYMLNLIKLSSRCSYLLMLFIVLPFFYYTNSILSIWLVKVPDYTDVFLKGVLLTILFEVLAIPLLSGLQAANKIKINQLTVSLLYLLNLPISYLLLKKGFPPVTPIYVNMALVIIAFLPRLILCKKYIHLSIISYLYDVVLRVVFLTLIGFMLGAIVSYYLPDSSLLSSLLGIACLIMMMSFIILLGGFNNKERIAIKKILIG